MVPSNLHNRSTCRRNPYNRARSIHRDTNQFPRGILFRSFTDYNHCDRCWRRGRSASFGYHRHTYLLPIPQEEAECPAQCYGRSWRGGFRYWREQIGSYITPCSRIRFLMFGDGFRAPFCLADWTAYGLEYRLGSFTSEIRGHPGAQPFLETFGRCLPHTLYPG